MAAAELSYNDSVQISDNSAVSNECQKTKNSHKEWKKMKRKRKRQTAAKNRNIAQKEMSDRSDSSESEEKLREQEFQHILFLEREKLAQLLFSAKKEKEKKEKEYLETQQRKIKDEWEELKIKEEEERERREKEDTKEKERQDALLLEATQHENKDAWHNPIAPVIYHSERPINECLFFLKTGACKYFDSCSRTHEYPEESQTVLLPGMFTHFRLDQSLIDEYDTDLSLEYEDSDLYNSFLEFYSDVIPEFRSVGKLTQFKVCSNCVPHLRGNVYVSFEKQEDAAMAVVKFNGRWYAGKQLNCEYRTIPKWKSAICGLFAQKNCPKGNICNFLHVFKNPNNEFRDADFDFQYHDHRNNNKSSNYRYPHHRWPRAQSRSRYSRSRSNSRSRSSRYIRDRSRSNSRSRSSRHRRKRSRSRSKRHKHKSRSRSPRCSPDRSWSSSRSRLCQERSRSNSRSRSILYTKERSKSQSDSDRGENKRKHSKKSKKNKKHKHSTRSDSNRKLKSNSPQKSKVSSSINDKINKMFGSINAEIVDGEYCEDDSTSMKDIFEQTTVSENESKTEQKKKKRKKYQKSETDSN